MLEAMARGSPVVITDNVGSRAYAVYEYNALIDNSHSSERLAELIQKVRKDENLR